MLGTTATVITKTGISADEEKVQVTAFDIFAGTWIRSLSSPAKYRLLTLKDGF
jgi:hypothetical protein